MEVKTEIVSKDRIKPSSPTPHHLRNLKISLLDQLAPPTFYVPILLFYSFSDISASGTDVKTISNKLKVSLSDVLTLYYPFCGRVKGNSFVECNDEGALYIESKVPIELSNILKTPQLYEINELFPFDPYNPTEPIETLGNMAVQLNKFRCGGIAIGVCFSHKIADGSTAATFLNAWAAISRGQSNNIAPQLEEAALLFPPRNIDIDIARGMVGHQNIVTKRFVFNATNISRLRQKLRCFNYIPTRVEAVTTLIWKSALEATKASSGKQKFSASMMSHSVNIRSRMASPLSNHSIGNLWQVSLSPSVEGEVGLRDLLEIVKKTVRKVDDDYISKLQGDGFPKVIRSLKESLTLVSQKGIPCYSFSSWIRFDFYEADFGWGNPSFVRTIGVPIKNAVILMATKDGNGIEAWLTLTTHDMVEFEHNPELLGFASNF